MDILDNIFTALNADLAVKIFIGIHHGQFSIAENCFG
jgi:hypothetical protein